MNPIFPNSAHVIIPERIVTAVGSWKSVLLKVRYGIFVSDAAGPVLIDTGYGPRVTTGSGRSMPLRLYDAVIRPRLVPGGGPEAALRRLGIDPEDVKLVVLTHFHADHVSALDRFPHARIATRRDLHDAIAARPVRSNLGHGIFRELLPSDLESRIDDVSLAPLVDAPLGLGSGRDLLGDGSLLAVDLPGHAEGHFGVCFPKLDTPLLYAVDAQWTLAALAEGRSPGPPASLVAADASSMGPTTRRVAAFEAAGGRVVLCHDPDEGPFDMREDEP